MPVCIRAALIDFRALEKGAGHEAQVGRRICKEGSMGGAGGNEVDMVFACINK